MSERTKPPFRADHVGSLLRTAKLKEAREKRARGEIAPDTSATLLLDTLIGGAMMHAMVTPDDRRADLARSTRAYAAQLVSFLLRAVTPA